MHSIYIVTAVLSFFGSALAADCFPSQDNPLNPQDIQVVADNLENNNLNPAATFPLSLPSFTTFHFNVGDVKFCVENDFPFSNTHVAQSDLVLAVQNIHDQCGSKG